MLDTHPIQSCTGACSKAFRGSIPADCLMETLPDACKYQPHTSHLQFAGLPQANATDLQMEIESSALEAVDPLPKAFFLRTLSAWAEPRRSTQRLSRCMCMASACPCGCMHMRRAWMAAHGQPQPPKEKGMLTRAHCRGVRHALPSLRACLCQTGESPRIGSAFWDPWGPPLRPSMLSMRCKEGCCRWSSRQLLAPSTRVQAAARRMETGEATERAKERWEEVGVECLRS